MTVPDSLQKTEKKPESLKQFLMRASESIAGVLPKHLTAERVARVALLAVDRDHTGKLKSCSPSSILGSIMQASQLGLEIGGAAGHAYLVPYWDKNLKLPTGKRGGYAAQFIPGYRGLVHLVWRAASIDIDADAVYEADEFDWSRGTDAHLTHRRSMDADRGKPLCYWAMARLEDGRRKFEIMSLAQVEAIRDRGGKPPGHSPWKTDFDEMAKKTVAKRLIKWLPIVDDKLHDAIDVDNRIETGDLIDYGDVIDIDPAPKSTAGIDLVRAAGADPGEMSDEEKAEILAEERGGE